MLTVSDGVACGTRQDETGEALAERLSALGFEVERMAVPDDVSAIREAVANGVRRHRLVVGTGGTGLGPRDRTPEAIRPLLEYEIPGFGEVMRGRGRVSTPFADLSRSLAGVIGRTLVIAVPGSPGAAVESLQAIEPILDHALETLGGHTEHQAS